MVIQMWLQRHMKEKIMIICLKLVGVNNSDRFMVKNRKALRLRLRLGNFVAPVSGLNMESEKGRRICTRGDQKVLKLAL